MPFCPDKKNVRTQILSGQINCRQENCPDKKNVRTKKMSGQKNCPDKFFLSALAMPLFFFLSIWLLIFVLSNFCQYFCLIVQQRHGTFSEIFYNFLGILWALVIATCLIKLLTKLPKISLKILSPKVYERLL